MYKYCYIFSLLIFDICFVINSHSFTSLCRKFKYDRLFVNWSLAMLCHPHRVFPSRLHSYFAEVLLIINLKNIRQLLLR